MGKGKSFDERFENELWKYQGIYIPLKVNTFTIYGTYFQLKC